MLKLTRLFNSKALAKRAPSDLAVVTSQRIAFIGLGNLANKIGPRLLIDSPENLISGYSPSGRQRSYAFTHPTIEATLANTNTSHVFYMFKPQHWNNKLKQQIHDAMNHFTNPPVKVSVLAGLGIDELECDITCMPNVLSEVGFSYTFSNARYGLTDSQKQEFANICRHMGPIYWVSKPQDMHLAVACSGSAPAYIMFAMDKAVKIAKLAGLSHDESLKVVISKFKQAAETIKNESASFKCVNFENLYLKNSLDPYLALILKLMSAYCLAMQKLGLDVNVSYEVCWNTVLGTAKLIEKQFNLNPKLNILTVMQEIMSKGGTTERAIAVAQTANFDILDSQTSLDEFMFNVLNAAYSRSIALQDLAKKKVNGLSDSSIFKNTEEKAEQKDNKTLSPEFTHLVV